MSITEREITRRGFIRVSALAGGGLLVACGGGRPGAGSGIPRAMAGNVVDPPADPVPSADNFQPHAYIKIADNNVITILIGPAEIGQGIITSVAQIVADELDADWDLVGWEQAPVATQYRNPIAGQTMLTAASFSIRGLWTLLRVAGAEIRQFLLEAAVSDLNASSVADLRTEKSFVINKVTGARISYGDLAASLAAQDPAYDPTVVDEREKESPTIALKNPGQFNLIGQSMKRLDGPEKANGTAVYGMDLYVDSDELEDKLGELLVAVVKRPDRFGEQIALQPGGDAAALAIPGVERVFPVPSGIAVVAKDYWSAIKGREALITTSTGSAETLSSSDLPAIYSAQNAASPGVQIHAEGNPNFTGTITSNYFFPFLGHGMMEPLNTIVNYTGGSAEIWVGSQWPDLHEIYAANVLGLSTGQITFNKLLAGGGFGRRANLYGDTIIEACEVAKVLLEPVKVVWSREDDITGGYYRPASACRLEANLEAGRIRDWGFRVTSTPIYPTAVVETIFRGRGADNEFTGLEPEVQTTQGAVELPYDIPNQRVGQNEAPPNQVPLLWVRSVANATNIYAVEHFFDQLAREAGADPLAFRLTHLNSVSVANGRHRAVVSAVGDALGWTGNAQTTGNTGFGMAVFGSYASVMCTGMQVTVSNPDAGGFRTVTIDRVVNAVDVGTVINPDLLKAQIESGIVFGLSSAMHSQITFDNGYVQQRNFDDFRVLRMFECPPIETIFLPNGDAPGGAGELGVPCTAPALANAITAVTGKTYDALPLAQHKLVFTR